MGCSNSAENIDEKKEIGKLKSNGDKKGIDENKGNQTSRAFVKYLLKISIVIDFL